jgi:hypothetical protein
MKEKILLGCVLFILNVFGFYLFRLKDSNNLLYGENKIEKSKLNYITWFDGVFQPKFETYFNQNFNLRNTLIKYKNQLDFFLFKEANSGDVKIGKNNYLYLGSYIDATTGKNFIGSKRIMYKMLMSKALQDTFAKQGKFFFLMFAPGKGSFYSENIPKKIEMIDSLNYPYYISYCKNFGINYIDFNSYLISLKNKTKYPFFTKYGVHWNRYAAYIVEDSIIKYLQYKNIPIPSIKDISIYNLNYSVSTDNDAEQLMNLIYPISKNNSIDVKLTYEKKQQKTNALFITDSYFLTLLELGFYENCFDNAELWFGKIIKKFKQEYNGNWHDLNLNDELKKYNVIGILNTDAVYHKYGSMFIENTYYSYFGDSKLWNDYKSNRLFYIKKEINNNLTYIETLKKNALQNKRSLQDEIEANAIWFFNEELKN